ncbi:hypothetical protein AVEN_16059-1 [Araneus ventricosus]|uniref:Gustatory receptor n=1 Tax=Araneus ventricosus TaxID=182803 RepID=A0A4Y2KCD1_ARAVE|nr:hypothetical protein AVEN_16059-1 [Araneus ventricosus]
MNRIFSKKIYDVHNPFSIINSLNPDGQFRIFRIYYKFYSNYLFAALPLYAVYLIITGLISGYDDEDTKLSISYIFVNLCLLSLWYSTLYQKKNLQFLTSSLLSHWKLPIHRPKKTFTGFANVFCINGTIPALLAASIVWLKTEEANQHPYWTFGQNIDNPVYQKAASFVGTYVYYTVSIEFLCVTILSLCDLIKHCGQYILRFSNNLKCMDFNIISDNHADILNDYNIIEKNIRHLREILSVPMFLILLCCFFNLYVALTYGIGNKLTSNDIIIEFVTSVFVGIAGITLLVIYSSQIPENMLKIKASAGYLIEKYQLSVFNSGKVYCTLDRIEKKEVIYLSAWGVVDFKKSFLLTAFGALLTYGLLILQLK